MSRTHVSAVINGEQTDFLCEAQQTLLDVLRDELNLTGSKLHPVQQKFLEHAALQCGFCTPGLLVAVKALLDRNPKPTETEARYWIAGNLCRCTGYDKVIRAVMDAAAEMRGEKTA